MSLIFLVFYLFSNLSKTGEARLAKQLRLPQPFVLSGALTVWQSLTQGQLRKFLPNRNIGVTSVLYGHPWRWCLTVVGTEKDTVPVPWNRWSEQNSQLHKKNCFLCLSLGVGGAEAV